MVTVRQAYLQIKQQLEEAQLPNAGWEADVLFEAVTGQKRFSMEPAQPLPPQQAEKLFQFAEKRAAHYPLQYLCGKWPFMNVELLIGEGVLIPRADTECVAERAISLLRGVKNPTVVDLCSGSGVIAAAIQAELPQAEVTAVELSEDALFYLRKNCSRVVQADIFSYQDALAVESVDLIVSNPPYITKEEMAQLQPEVQHEPTMALYGGEDGLTFYRHIAKAYLEKLRCGGFLVFEIGAAQGKAVKELCESLGYQDVTVLQDWAGLDRCVSAKRANK